MRIGAMNNPRKSLLDEVHLIGSMGFEYLDLTIEYPQATPELIRSKQKELMEALASHNLALVGHMPWFLNIIHPYESVRKAVNMECERIFEMCQELGIAHVTIHPDFMKLKRGQKELLEETRQSMALLSDSASERGLTLCLENFEEEYFTIDNLKQLFAEVPKLRFTLDVGHAYMKARRADTLTRMISNLKPYLTHVHMHDNHGSRDEHLPLGVGSIDFPRIIEALKHIGYDKTITLEIHADDREYLQISQRKLREMWG